MNSSVLEEGSLLSLTSAHVPLASRVDLTALHTLQLGAATFEGLRIPPEEISATHCNRLVLEGAPGVQA